jgi:hypothetical protein
VSQQQCGIEPQSALLDAPDVYLKLLRQGQVVAAIGLRPACHTGPDFVPSGLTGRLEGQTVGQLMPAWRDTHVPAEHVPKLGQFVEAARDEAPPDSRDV